MRIGTKLPVRLTAAVLALALGPMLGGCGGSDGDGDHDPEAAAQRIAEAVATGLRATKVTVLGRLPHAADTRTEGLEIYNGTLYESARLPGRSELRELDPRTGQLTRAAALPRGMDAGGITVTGSLIWQLVQPDEIALQWNRETLNAGGRVPWEPHARGMCHDENSLFGSDGSNRIRVVDRDTGVRTDRTLDVRLKGRPLTGLDELECLPGRILAIVAGTTWIVSIDSRTGAVLSTSDLSALVPPAARGNRDASPNGIALIPGTDTFLITGNLWPTMPRIRFE